MPSTRPETRLARCPTCSSGLIYPIDIAAWGQRAVVTRRCPECQHRDTVSTCPLAALVWFARMLRIGEGLAALSEAMADGLPTEFVLADPPSAEEVPPAA
jgi:hypothetical protein